MPTTLNEIVTNNDGTITKHTYVSEYTKILSLHDWLNEVDRKDDRVIITETEVNGHSTESLNIYKEWIDSQKIVHTVEHHDGKIEVFDYKTWTP